MVASHLEERAGLLHPLRASQIVAEHVTRDITVVGDGALTYLWLSEVIAEARPEALLFHSHLSSMGCGFGIAVGAQAGVEPGERVILVAGDGAVGYSLAEFEAAVRNGLPLIVVAMNNRSWGATLHFQQIVVGANRVTGIRLETGGAKPFLALLVPGPTTLTMRPACARRSRRHSREASRPASTCWSISTPYRRKNWW